MTAALVANTVFWCVAVFGFGTVIHEKRPTEFKNPYPIIIGYILSILATAGNSVWLVLSLTLTNSR